MKKFKDKLYNILIIITAISIILFIFISPFFIIKIAIDYIKNIPNCETYYNYTDLDGVKDTSYQCKGFSGSLYCGDKNRAVLVKEIEKVEVCK